MIFNSKKHIKTKTIHSRFIYDISDPLHSEITSFFQTYFLSRVSTFQEISGNIGKYQEISRKYQEISENFIHQAYLQFDFYSSQRLMKRSKRLLLFIDRFFNKEDASRAIVGRHLSEINGHIVKCSWGKKSDDTSPGCSSTSPVPVPPLAQMHSSPSPVSMIPAVTKITHQQTV